VVAWSNLAWGGSKTRSELESSVEAGSEAHTGGHQVDSKAFTATARPGWI